MRPLSVASLLALSALAHAQTIQGLGAPGQAGLGYFGQSVASIPDVNGDGRPDIAVLEPNFGQGLFVGRIRLFSGATGGYLRTISPVSLGGLVFQQNVIAGIPDVNGDGRGDIIVGCAPDSPGVSPDGAGRAYIYSGATGVRLRTLNSPLDQLNGAFGYTVAGIPDINGDGRGDVAVGAPFENPGASPADCGRVYVYSGATGVRLFNLISPVQQLNGHFGNSVSAVPDVNGDGVPDIIVGADGESTNPASPLTEGRAHVYSGASGARLRTFLTPRATQLGGFGQIVVGIPDINGDGRGEILITAPGHDPFSSLALSSGMAYLYSGATGAQLRQLATPNRQVNGQFGFSAAAILDCTGDGKPDLLFGAPYESPGAVSHAGRAYIFNGATGTVFRTLVSPNREPDGNFGFGVAGMGDVNGNNRGEALIGAPYEDPGASAEDCGRTYIYRF